MELLENAVLYGKDAGRAGEAARLMKGAHLHGPGAALDVLVKLGHWEEDENLDLRRRGAPLAFGSAAIEASEVAAGGATAWPAVARRSRRVWLRRPVGLVQRGEACFLAAHAQRWPGGYRVAVHVPALSLLVPAWLFFRTMLLLLSQILKLTLLIMILVNCDLELINFQSLLSQSIA